MSQLIDRGKSLEQLEGRCWPDPPEETTSLVRSVHALRRRPIGALQSHELARLIGQSVGLPWLLPLAVEILRDTAPDRAAGGFYDDDLLYAVVTVSPEVWKEMPALASDLKATVTELTDLSSYVKPDVDQFLASLPEGV
ncbi:contact-dependent growth inhibition system immunity protein [Streptomyces sp. NPDC096152]|uniref:contact-dependent growth inhibition system immunity protein n=1 Tax=Streptomyces sp. NPDC096152 TaxID=3366078 RepID=UPI0037F5FF6F